MEIEIQAYWGANIQIMESIGEGGRKCTSLQAILSPEEFLRKRSHIVLCSIVIDGKLRGHIIWDGRYLNILHPQEGAFKVEEEK